MTDTEARPEEGRMTLIEHLTELRRRLIISFSAIAVGAVIGWIFYNTTIEFLADPYCDLVRDRTIDGESVVPLEQTCNFYFTDPLEPFNVKLMVAGYSGIILAMPVILWQIWRFVAPGLYNHEKRYAYPFIASAVGLFALGAGLAYWSVPKALNWLIGQGGENFQELFAPQQYIGFIVKMMLAFGIGFEFPIALIFLQLLGLVENETLRKGRQYAIVGIVALVAVITPSGDPFTLAVLSVPMYLFYEIAILFGRLRIRRAKKAASTS
ncbi:MAG: twin-arginine translocase subunit TatC [Actinomycetota bacterium]